MSKNLSTQQQQQSSYNVTNHNAYFYIFSSSFPSAILHKYHLLGEGKTLGATRFFACCLGLRRLMFSFFGARNTVHLSPIPFTHTANTKYYGIIYVQLSRSMNSLMPKINKNSTLSRPHKFCISRWRFSRSHISLLFTNLLLDIVSRNFSETKVDGLP